MVNGGADARLRIAAGTYVGAGTVITESMPSRAFMSRSRTEYQMIVIAEIGVNHNGDVSLAKELIDQSAEAGADIVKFIFKAKNIVSKFAEQADYQKRNTGSSKSQLEPRQRP